METGSAEELTVDEAKDQLTTLTLVNVVCRLPKFYTLNQTFAEVVALLNGFYLSLEWRKASPEEVSEWIEFCVWVAARLDLDHPEQLRSPWLRIHLFERIRQEQPDDQAALKQLDDWWTEFWSARHP